MRKLFFMVASLLLLPAGNTYATSIGYSNGVINRKNVFRLGSTETQGQAIRLSHAKLQALKGKTIDYAEFVVGSKNTNDNKLKVFLTTQLGGTPIAEGTLTIGKALQKIKWTLDTPYAITGDEPDLYIGFTADIDTNYKFLISDGSYDIDGYNFAYKDGEWADTYGLNKGSALISANVADAPSYADAIVGYTNLDGYFKAGNDYDFEAHFINAGTTAINSFNAVVTVGDKEQTLHFADIDIAPNASYSFSLGGIESQSQGEQDVRVRIVDVNGSEGDIDDSDNTISGNVFFYPHDMERSLLVEGFTGQDCSNCPSGHLNISSALASIDTEKYVEVSHHVGYQPDIFTMKEDDAYRFYYGDPTSTYAPAVMVNRCADNSISAFPVINTDTPNICKLINNAASTQPYVSLSLNTELDASSRELKVKLQIMPQTWMPSKNILFNVFLMQDGIQAYQYNGGDNYTHNRVFRGTITGNAWGITAEDLRPGYATSWETTINIPESIHSSYWTDDMLNNGKYGGKYKAEQTDIKAVLDNMTLVAFVGEYDVDDNSRNVVYNCCEVKLGESYKQGGFDSATGVTRVDKDEAVGIYGDKGKVSVVGTPDKVGVYNLAGRQVDASSTLEPGIYIVRVVSGGKLTTKKVLVK